ncbi:hypothetical protein [Naasia sp. SYSU D00948]|uniref:hypothetical protein n=1 Tax=Naasia sp. SYSU D00948 TaxID=2817379 RepID=UPI001B30EA13|nr:hypothetical protein [Naasia sp. SYSU D00948]
MTDPGSSDWQSPGGAPQRPRYGERSPGPAAPAPSIYDAPGAGGQGWTPPPKPGIVPLRPLGFGTLLLAPFSMLRRAVGILGISLLLQFVLLLVQGALVAVVVFAGFARITDWTDPAQQPLIAGSVVGAILGALGVFALSFVVSALLQGIVVGAAARAILGESTTVGQVWQRLRGNLGPLIGWTLLLGSAILLTVLLLTGIVVLGVTLGGAVGAAISIGIALLLGLGAVALWIWLYTKTSLVPSLIVLEHATIRRAIVRSWRLTDGYFWRTFGAQALVTIMVTVALQLITTPLGLLQFVGVLIDPNDTGTGVTVAVIVQIIAVAIGLLGGAVTTLVTSTLIALIYLDLRMRKEGLDLVLQRHVESGRKDVDPFRRGAG